jgi:two-component system, cell cycle response regulator
MFLSPPSNPRILVATADTKLELRLAKILAAMGYSVERSQNATDTLTILLGATPPEIALIDAVLPGQPLAVAAEIKRRPGKKHTWITLLCSAADSATVAAAAEAGVDDLLLFQDSGPSDDPVSETISAPVSEVDLRVRLNVAARVQEFTRQLEAQVEAISFQSLRDNLTGLWNRESLLSLLFPETDRVQRIGTPLGFLLLDLDHFARVNAEYGYETGDKILHQFADRLRRYLRSYDLIGRCGEDEFLIALPGCTSSDARKLASRIRNVLLRRPFAAGREMITLTASMGIAESRGRSPLVVLREAERALASAKLGGRNCEREFVAPLQKWEEQPPEQRQEQPEQMAGA